MSQNLFEQQTANRRRSAWLVAGFILFFAWVGFGGDLAWYVLSAPGPGDPVPASRHTIPFIGVITALVAAGLCWSSWKHGTERVLWATGAREVLEPAGEREQQLVNVVEEMAIASGLPRPRIFVVPDADPNAFATGIDPAHGCVAVTQGLLAALDRDELQGVVAHEMAHIRNLDTRLMTMLAALVGAIALLSDGMSRVVRYGNLSGRGGRGGGRGKGNPLGLALLVFWGITLILAPIVSRLLAMAVSRRREYLADATGAQFTRNPGALASALERIEGAVAPTRAITRGAAHLCIADPAGSALSAREGRLGDLLASHPPMRMRIARLRGMAYQAAKRASTGSAGDTPATRGP